MFSSTSIRKITLTKVLHSTAILIRLDYRRTKDRHPTGVITLLLYLVGTIPPEILTNYTTIGLVPEHSYFGYHQFHENPSSLFKFHLDSTTKKLLNKLLSLYSWCRINFVLKHISSHSHIIRCGRERNGLNKVHSFQPTNVGYHYLHMEASHCSTLH